MAFTDFNSPDEVQKAYNITYCEKEFLHPVPRTPSENFLQDIEFSRTNFDIFSSEASRCEAVIFPLLREACKTFVTNYSLWSHKAIAVAADAKLSGTPHYIIARRSELGKNVLGAPLVLNAEVWQFGRLAKKSFTRNLRRAVIDDIAEVFGSVYRIMELAAEMAAY